MESSSLNSEESKLQQMQLEERKLHQKCLGWFKRLKIHLENLHKFFEVRNTRPFKIAFRIFFREEHQTFREKITPFKKCFDSKEIIDERVLKYGELRMKEREVQAIKEIEKRLKEKEIQQQDSLVTEGIILYASLVTKGIALVAILVTEGISLDASLSTNVIALDASLVTEGITLDVGLVAKQSTVDSSTSSEQLDESSNLGNENKSSDNESNSSGNDLDAEKILIDTTASDIENADIGPSYDSDTISEVNHDMFENVFAHGIQNHEQPESIPDTYVVNENNSHINSYIPNMDPDKENEEHDDVNYEQQHAFFISLINNFKCDVKNVIWLIVKKSRLELYMMNRQHGRMILESVENGPLIWPIIEENGVTRPRKYSELTPADAIQADYDVKATNIILQGLPPEVYALVSNHRIAKELWERIQLLMQGTSLTK
ncbi:hypothetical protein Tco_0059583 [Tanacetum coccineum]